MLNKEDNLTLNTLLYAAACQAKGDWAALREINFGEQEIKALSGINLPEFYLIADRMNGSVVNIELDRDRFWRVMQEVEQAVATDHEKADLVRRQAPIDMMRQLFGMTDREYTTLRRRLRCGRGAGRPPEPDTATMNRIWQAWQHHLDGRPPGTGVEWLELSDQSDVDCRTLWRFIRDTSAMEQQA